MDVSQGCLQMCPRLPTDMSKCLRPVQGCVQKCPRLSSDRVGGHKGEREGGQKDERAAVQEGAIFVHLCPITGLLLRPTSHLVNFSLPDS